MATYTHEGREFPVFDCEMCGPALLCPTCGNNSCNGGNGTVDGEMCLDCDVTYAASQSFWRELP